MSTGSICCIPSFLLPLLTPALLPAQCDIERAKLLPPVNMPNASFGFDVAISGTTAVVGAPYHASVATNNGTAHVYEPVNGVWQHRFQIQAPDAAAYDNFGRAVDIDGDTLVVGSPRSAGNGVRSGSIYVFERVGAGWQFRQKLTDAPSTAQLGTSIALAGDTLVAGAPYSSNNQGAAYVYERAQGVWQLRGVFGPTAFTSNAFYGASVAVGDGLIAIGASNASVTASRSGMAWILERQGTVWQQTGYVYDPTGQAVDLFGDKISLFERTLAVGAPGAGTHGEVFAYGHDGVQFRPMDGGAGFGEPVDTGGAVALSANTLLTGDRSGWFHGTTTQSGTGNVKYWSLGRWRQAAGAQPASSDQADNIGCAVDIEYHLGIVGALGDDDRGADAGAAYVFEFPCGGYQLKPIEPAVAGQLNTIDVERAIRPFSLVLVGTFEGWIPIPGWLPTQGLRIANFAILTTLHQPTNPAMTFDVPVPAALQGFEVLVQAMELDTQALSNLQRVRFQ